MLIIIINGIISDLYFSFLYFPHFFNFFVKSKHMFYNAKSYLNSFKKKITEE